MIHITALYSGLLALMYIVFSYNVASKRRRLGVGAGDGENRLLLKAIRIHSNFIEYVPLLLILMAIFELNQGSSTILHISGVSIFIARVAHYMGLSKTLGASKARMLGVSLTWLILIKLAALNIYYAIFSIGLSG